MNFSTDPRLTALRDPRYDFQAIERLYSPLPKDSPTMADVITYEDFAKLELRVAKVLEVRPHPNADRTTPGTNRTYAA